MAAVFRRMIFARSPCKFLLRRQIHTEFRANKHVTRLQIACGCATGAAIVGYLIKSNLTPPINTSVVASKGDDQRSSEKRAVLQTQRELRFLSFASVEYDGNVYMTPQDFLESVTEEAPRPRAGRRHLSCNEVEKWFYGTSRKGRGSTNLFRNLHEKGLISYTEYLFLLCVLTKPKSGFQIAFNMFDTDGNQRVDKKEFLVLQDIVLKLVRGHPSRSSALQKATTARTALSMVVSSDDLDNIQSKLLDVYESRFGESRLRQTDTTTQLRVANIWTHLKSLESVYEGLIAGMPKGSSDSQAHDPEDGSPIMDTTLTVHFFGRKGKDTLKYEDFHRFMDNLQTEVLELEFGEFSRGMQTIDEVEFAQILLRYTILTTDEHEEYLQRLRSKVTNVQGITFQEFKDFCQFLNNLDDFALAMRMYTYANHPISQEDFKRAVMACTGQSLSDHVVDVVYKLFDKDNDNHLSHKEFISVMKDRLHRGFRNYNLPQNNWDTFKSCVKNEMRAA